MQAVLRETGQPRRIMGDSDVSGPSSAGGRQAATGVQSAVWANTPQFIWLTQLGFAVPSDADSIGTCENHSDRQSAPALCFAVVIYLDRRVCSGSHCRGPRRTRPHTTAGAPQPVTTQNGRGANQTTHLGEFSEERYMADSTTTPFRQLELLRIRVMPRLLFEHLFSVE